MALLRLALCILATAPVGAFAAWIPPAGVDLTRPRILLRQADIPVIQERLEREPYSNLARAMMQRARQADRVTLEDETIEAHRFKSRAAKNLAFFYAVERTVRDGEVVPFESPAERQAVGDRVRDLLTHIYPRSRIAVPAPLGGWDRDISTSEELLQYATAYDTMLGAGYDFGADDAVIIGRLTDIASELYDNFLNPETAATFTNLHNNNHRSKSGAALVVAGLALAEQTPEPGSDPRGTRDPALWIDYGLDLVDLIMRYVLVTGDGAYGEGPFYFGFAGQNLLPFGRAWDRLLDGRTYSATTRGLEIPSLWSHPLFLRGQRWVLDVTLPDGSLAPFDDGNPGRSYYFGLAPGSELASAFAWRWINTPAPYYADGNVDLAADAIVAFDDTVVPAPPPGSPTAFYVEGGNAIFRSDWSPDAVVAIVQAEHDTASEFGRDRDGRGVGPQSHEHAEPGAFLLHAFGERLLLDPGYLDFSNRGLVNRPQDHNLILVDGMGPVDYLNGSGAWRGKTGRPPVDGHAMLSSTLDSGFVDAATVTSRYGQPRANAAQIGRRFIFADDRYLVVADDVIGPGSAVRSYTWLLHGNGGETSGGTFEQTNLGGRWTQGGARIDAAAVFDRAVADVEVGSGIHELPGRIQSTHSVLRTTVAGETVRSLQVLYPSRMQQAVPIIEDLAAPGLFGLTLTDAESDRRVLAVRRQRGHEAIAVAAGVWSGPAVESDGRLLIADVHLDQSLRFAWAEDASHLIINGVTYIESVRRGGLGAHLTEGRAEIIAATGDAEVRVRGLSFVPLAVDGACGFEVVGDEVVVGLGRERRATLKAELSNSIPAADPGADRVVAVGETVVLDGTASCDADGDPLTPRWELVAAPTASAWQLTQADGWNPQLWADVPGPYRLRLRVTDDHGAESWPVEVVVTAGGYATDGLDNDADGLFDSDDPDGDTGSVCAGDCTGEGEVTVDELIRAVDIALGERPLLDCGTLDVDDDGRVTVDEVLTAATAALKGCLAVAVESGR